MGKRETVATHEAGHALLAYQNFGEKAVGAIDLKGGFTSFPAVEVSLDGGMTRNDALACYAQMALGGLAAEEVLLERPTWAHGSVDLDNVKKQFRRLDEPLPDFNHENGAEIAEILTSGGKLGDWYSGAVEALTRDRAALRALAESLSRFAQDVVEAQDVLAQIKVALDPRR